MNKLLVVEDIKIVSDGNYELEYEKASKIIINNEVYLSNFAHNNKDISVEIEDNAKLNFNKVNILTADLKVDLIIKSNAYLEFNFVIINNGNNKVIINVSMIGDNSSAFIKFRAINKNQDSNLDIICNGKVLKESQNNELLEDLKGLIINDGQIKISPNMIIDTNEVMANHQVTIGPVNKEDIFYLKTRAISESIARKMLIEAFSTSIVNEDESKKIKLEVKECE